MGVGKTLQATAVLKLLALAVVGLSATGCAVHEEPGSGTQLRLTEAQAKRQYYLYLPAGYDPNKRYPVVMAIHCIRPIDSAHRQIREWESTADKYGFIVAAPAVGAANPVPLWFNQVDSTMKRDDLRENIELNPECYSDIEVPCSYNTYSPYLLIQTIPILHISQRYSLLVLTSHIYFQFLNTNLVT